MPTLLHCNIKFLLAYATKCCGVSVLLLSLKPALFLQSEEVSLGDFTVSLLHAKLGVSLVMRNDTVPRCGVLVLDCGGCLPH